MEDSSNLTFDGSTLTVNGDVSVAGTITYQEVSEIDAVGFVTARKGVRVTNGGVIVTAGLSTFSDDVKFAGANYNITFDRSADDLIFDDGARAIFGTGSDGLQIYHESNNSYVEDAGTGGLILLSNGTLIEAKFGAEHAIKCTKDAQVDLYYDNSVKLSTGTGGVAVTGSLTATSGSDVVSLGSDGSIEITRAAGGAFIDFKNSTGEDYDLRIQEESGALKVTGNVKIADSIKFIAGDGGDLELFHNGTNTHIDNNTGDLYIRNTGNNNDIYIRARSGENSIICYDDGSVALYYDDTKRFETSTQGISVTGNIDLSSELNFTGPAHKYIDFYTKASDNTKYNATIRLVNHDSSDFDTAINMEREGEVQLYHSGSEKLNTTSSGVTVTGSVTDSLGNLRAIPLQDESGGAYTLVATDAGQCVHAHSSTTNITVNPSVFAAGDAVSIVNADSSDLTITQGSSMTLRNTADASTGNRTLSQFGMATIWFSAHNVAYISGSGLS